MISYIAFSPGEYISTNGVAIGISPNEMPGTDTD
jgi:hypothetical protein